MKLKYESITPIDKLQAEGAFATGNTDTIVHALLGISQYELDWEWVENKCLEYLDSSVPEVRSAAIISLGHLARSRRKLHKGMVLQALSRFSTDPEYSGRIEDAIDDIETFVS